MVERSKSKNTVKKTEIIVMLIEADLIHFNQIY